MVRKALTVAPASPVANTSSTPGGTALPLGSRPVRLWPLSQACEHTARVQAQAPAPARRGRRRAGLGAATTHSISQGVLHEHHRGTGEHVRSAATSLGTTQSTGSAAGSSGPTGDLLGTDATSKQTQVAGSSDPKNLYRLTLVARTPAGLVTRHTVVIWLDGRADRPYRVLDWSPPELAGQEVG